MGSTGKGRAVKGQKRRTDFSNTVNVTVMVIWTISALPLINAENVPEAIEQRLANQKKVKCATCGGGHRADSNSCRVKAKAIESQEFKDEKTSKATKITAEAKATPSSCIRHSISTART